MSKGQRCEFMQDKITPMNRWMNEVSPFEKYHQKSNAVLKAGLAELKKTQMGWEDTLKMFHFISFWARACRWEKTPDVYSIKNRLNFIMFEEDELWREHFLSCELTYAIIDFKDRRDHEPWKEQI